MTLPEDAPADIPPSFLPAPKKRGKSFDDDAMFEPPTGGLTRPERIAAYEAETWPGGPPPPPWWWGWERKSSRQQEADAVAALLVGRQQ